MVTKIEELRQILVKEEINEIRCSHLQPDFYKKTNLYLFKCTDEKEMQVINNLLQKIVDKRIGKLLTYIDVIDLRKIREGLTNEECLFWEQITRAQQILKDSVLLEMTVVDKS